MHVNLESDHFPVKSVIKCQFKKQRRTNAEQPERYTTRCIETNRKDMNEFFKLDLCREDRMDYTKWADCYKQYVGKHERRKKGKKQIYISSWTLRKLRQRNEKGERNDK